MRKQAIHIKSYNRSRHGRAKFGGKVSAHQRKMLANVIDYAVYTDQVESEDGESGIARGKYDNPKDRKFLLDYAKKMRSGRARCPKCGDIIGRAREPCDYCRPFYDNNDDDDGRSGRADVGGHEEEDLRRYLHSKGMSNEQIEAGIREKNEEYAGLLTRVGSIYSIAREHGFPAGEKSGRAKVRLLVKGKWEDAYGDFKEPELDAIAAEMAKPKGKRRYVGGIEFSNVDQVDIRKDRPFARYLSRADKAKGLVDAGEAKNLKEAYAQLEDMGE